MAIPEAQLETWSHRGSVQQSSATHTSTAQDAQGRQGTSQFRVSFVPVCAATIQGAQGRQGTASVTVNPPAALGCTCDGNGNLLSNGNRYFAYDNESQLVSAWLTNAWRGGGLGGEPVWQVPGAARPTPAELG